MPEHTPGPWGVRYVSQHLITIYAKGRHEICDFFPHRQREPLPRAAFDANARLVAAAPTMLAALEAAVAEWDYPADNLDKRAIHAMRAAIAEAKEEPDA